VIDLAELLRLIETRWPARYARGRILHIHQNAVKTSAGLVHLRVMVQRIEDPDYQDGNQGGNSSEVSWP
jgi:hypothetical protein